MWSRGLTWRSQVGANPIPIPNPTNLALFGHKITLYRFNQGAYTIAWGSNQSRGHLGLLTLTTGSNHGGMRPPMTISGNIFALGWWIWTINFSGVFHRKFLQCRTIKFGMVTHMGRAVCTSATSVAFAQMRRAVCQRQLIFLFPFQILFIVSLLCAWNIITVKINSGLYLLKICIRQVPLFTYFVLVLRIWSCLHY